MIGFEKMGNLEQKIVFDYVEHEILFNEWCKINFEILWDQATKLMFEVYGNVGITNNNICKIY